MLSARPYAEIVLTKTLLSPDLHGAINPERQKRIIEVLKELGLDALICGSASDVLLLTGYWPVMGASVALFTVEGKVQVVLPEDEVELAERSSEVWLTPYKPSDLTSLTTPIEAIAGPLHCVISRLGLSRAAIGIPVEPDMAPASYASSNRFGSALLGLMRRVLPDAEFLACDNALQYLKSRKTQTEVERIRKAIAVAAAGFDDAVLSIKAGEREAEVAARAQAAFQASPKAEFVQRSYGFFFCMSGPNSASASAAYARTRQRVLEPGDPVMIHANTCADGYWTDITRTYTAGTPTDRQNAMRSAIAEARKNALHAIRPGVAAREVDAAARNVMTAHGFGEAFQHSTGHGVGFAAANANALPRIHPESRDVLEEGMTFNIEPAAYFEGYGGMRHCDVVAVTAKGADVLTEF